MSGNDQFLGVVQFGQFQILAPDRRPQRLCWAIAEGDIVSLHISQVTRPDGAYSCR
jgi:predicted SnoaL-like aldol condensation-catalyzing enzyme